MLDKYAKLLQLDTIRLSMFMKNVYKRVGEIDKEGDEG
jgi:hypothetical protein